jgi:HEPN domain-containing protein
VDDRSAYWLDMAEYDMETARAMLRTARFLYVGFMCHQVIEKVLKAYFVRVKRADPPYTHNLRMLAASCGLYERLTDDQKDSMEMLAPLNIEARYPAYKQQMLRDMTEQRCTEILGRTEALYEWTKRLLSSE